MLKKVSMFLFAALLLGAMVYAADTTAAKPASSSMTAAAKIEGTITKIDAAKHTLTVQTGADATSTKLVTWSSKTKLTMGGKTVKSTDLKEGEKVSVTADSKGWAKDIEVSAPAAQ